MSKKVLIISSFFEPHIGYQEVQFAEALHSMGYIVKVLATDRSNLDLKKRYEDSANKFEVKRIKKLIRIKNTFYPRENLKAFFSKFTPDIVFLILPGSGTPYFLLKYIDKKAKVISVFSDTTIDGRVYKAKGTKGNKHIFNFLKSSWYNKIFNRSSLLLANTNETALILKSTAGKNIDSKLRIYGLGFDLQKYFYSEKLRNEYRDKLGIQDNQKLIVTISRIYRGKPFEFWVAQVSEFLKENNNFVYLLAGFDDTEYSKKVKQNLKALNLNNNLILHNFTSPDETNGIFNAADFSLWFAPTISIQQSMAAGAFAVMPYDSTLDHLIENENTGKYYRNYDELRDLLKNLNSLKYERIANAEANKKFSSQNILQKIIAEAAHFN